MNLLEQIAKERGWGDETILQPTTTTRVHPKYHCASRRHSLTQAEICILLAGVMQQLNELHDLAQKLEHALGQGQ